MDSVRTEHLLLLILSLGVLYLLASRDHWREQARKKAPSADAARLLQLYNKNVLDLIGKMLWSDDEKQHREHVPAAIRSYNEGVLFLLRACNEGLDKGAAIAAAPAPESVGSGGQHLRLLTLDEDGAEEEA